jgi:hypothetical protein
MPLQLPKLDDRHYADLVAEARRLIPVHDPDWTDHNPSDPGITLLELFAYLTEMLLYRLDRVTGDNQRKFLKLLNGPDWTHGADLKADIRTAVLAVHARDRAVTAADFERLAIEDFIQWVTALQRVEEKAREDGTMVDQLCETLNTDNPLKQWWRTTQLEGAKANLPSNMPGVVRACCVPSRNLDRGTEATRTECAPGHVSLIVLPQDTDRAAQDPDREARQKKALWGYLDEKRMLTTRHHVVGPHYVRISAEIVVATVVGASTSAVRDRVAGRPGRPGKLQRFLDPLSGGTAQEGWPFGRDVYVSELYEEIETIDGVDYITDLMLFATASQPDEQAAPAQQLWHPAGDLIGISFEQHQLPRFDFGAATVVVAPSTSFVAIQLAVTLTKTAVADPAILRRQAKIVVRQFLHPLYGGPGPATSADRDLLLAELENVLHDISGVTQAEVMLQADDATRLVMANGRVIGLHVKAGEIVNWQTEIEFSDA